MAFYWNRYLHNRYPMADQLKPAQMSVRSRCVAENLTESREQGSHHIPNPRLCQSSTGQED
jgi:hypothetical protein